MLVLNENEKFIIGRVQVHKSYDKMMYMVSNERTRELFFREIFSSKNYNLSYEEWIKENVGFIKLKNGMYITGKNIKEIKTIIKKIFEAEKIDEKYIIKPGLIIEAILKYL